MKRYNSLLSDEPPPAFAFIDPPFNFNSATVSKYPPEVTGSLILRSLCRRLGWPSLAEKRLLDFGCGVRLPRAIINLGIEIGLYAGVDVNADAIEWLRSNVQDERFRFERINMRNALFNPSGDAVTPGLLEEIGLTSFDAACMFSVITHQNPQDATTIFCALWRSVKPGGKLYFTAFVDDTIDRYAERDASNSCAWCSYNPEYLIELAEEAGWIVRTAYAGSTLHQPAFVCDRRD